MGILCIYYELFIKPLSYHYIILNIDILYHILGLDTDMLYLNRFDLF